MKLEIMGFSQQGLLALGLDIEDAVLLRWFIDYQGTQRMKAVPNPDDGKMYFWVSFIKVCEDLPMITRSDRYMSRKFDKLVAVGVLEKYSTIGPKGKISSFRISDGDQYLSLITSMSVKGDMAALKSDMAVQNGDMALSPNGDMQSNLNNLPSNNNTVDNQLKDKEVCSEQPENGAQSRPSAVVRIPLNNGTFYDISQEQVDNWTQLYPAVDVLQELRKMVGWCEGHPRQRKTKAGVLGFVNRWLAKEQDYGRRGGVKAPLAVTTGSADFSGVQGGEVVW